MLRGSTTTVGLNHRQVALLGHVLKHPDSVYTIDGHRRSHNVTYETARTDLAALDSLGLVAKYTRGRRLMYRMADRFEERLKRFAT